MLEIDLSRLLDKRIVGVGEVYGAPALLVEGGEYVYLDKTMAESQFKKETENGRPEKGV